VKLIPDYLWGVLTVWQEARGEPFAGKVAVAEVILRRTQKKFFSSGDSIASTCLWPLQFSGWNAKDPNRIKAAVLDTTDPDVQDCVKAWCEAADRGSNLVPDALHYYNANIVNPPWAKDAEVVAVIGNHTFLRGVK
jgi:N-acetylmuramoyl-L-alanine amidase